MISKVSIHQDTAVVWIPKATNLHGQSDLPTFDFGRITLEPHKTPLNPDDAVRLTRRFREGNPEWGFKFYGGDEAAVKRVIKQVEFLQKLDLLVFQKFLQTTAITTTHSLPQVLASLDCDPSQKAEYAIMTSEGPLRKIFPKKYSGFGINLKGKNFEVEVVVNKNEFVWSNYLYKKKIDSCNYNWIHMCLESDNAKSN